MERERKQDGDKSRHDTIEVVSIRWTQRRRRCRAGPPISIIHSLFITLCPKSHAGLWRGFFTQGLEDLGHEWPLQSTFPELFPLLRCESPMWVFLEDCPLSLYVTKCHWRTACSCNAWVTITHILQLGWGPLGRVLTFMVKRGVWEGFAETGESVSSQVSGRKGLSERIMEKGRERGGGREGGWLSNTGVRWEGLKKCELRNVEEK